MAGNEAILCTLLLLIVLFLANQSHDDMQIITRVATTVVLANAAFMVFRFEALCNAKRFLSVEIAEDSKG